MTGALSPTHWAIIVVVVLLLFGAKRLPDAARGLGKSMRILKAETASLSGRDEQDGQPDQQTAAARPSDAIEPTGSAGTANTAEVSPVPTHKTTA